MTDTTTQNTPDTLFDTVLIANRGEIARRIIRTLDSLGMRSVAIYSSADADAPHVTEADQAVYLGETPADSYLNIPKIIQAAKDTGAQAIHPGYGFVSENVEMVRACQEAGITFIGPGEQALEVMGDKIRSKNHVAQAGVPLVAGISEPGLTDEQLIEAGKQMPFPVLIKPSAGGGGKGMYVVNRPEDLAEALVTARRIAKTSFGDDTLFIEQLVASPRHIEVQVLADAHGNVIHLGERECSLQRRHQKVIEEAPSALLTDETRARIGQAAIDTARSVNYLGAGTVEFLVSDLEPDKFYFMEMNTRLQVEHPVTEEITGVDLVAEQVRIAAGRPLSLTQDDVVFRGHSVEARVYAEVPEAGFMPSIGTVLEFREPRGEGVRVDSGLETGSVVGTQFDPMVAKVITHGADRRQAFARLNSALADMTVLGVETNISYLRQLTVDEDVLAGAMDTTMIERKLPEMQFPRPSVDLAQAAAAFLHRNQSAPSKGWISDGWRVAGAVPASYQVIYQAPEQDDEVFDVTVDPRVQLRPTQNAGQFQIITDAGRHILDLASEKPGAEGTRVWVKSAEFTGVLIVQDHEAYVTQQLRELEREQKGADPQVKAPLPGTVIAVHVSNGQEVGTSDALVTIEAMKMEHKLEAPFQGTVNISVSEGDQVKLGDVLATVAGEESDA